jgi:hypothetical protein
LLFLLIHASNLVCWVVVRVGPKLALPRLDVNVDYSTVIPIDRAVPAMILAAASMSLALRSAFFVSALIPGDLGDLGLVRLGRALAHLCGLE